jgi:hypothetical protein
MREDWPERPEMEDMRRLVELYARGYLPPDVLTCQTRRLAFRFSVVAPVRRWVVALCTRAKATPEAAQSPEAEIPLQRLAR